MNAGKTRLSLVPKSPPEDAPRSDDALMALAGTDREDAFAELVRRHEVAVRRLCLVMLNDDGLARDTAQETFLRLWQLRTKYRPEGRFRELAFTIARNLCRRASRRRSFFSLFGLQPDEGAEPSHAPVAAEAEDAQTAALVRAALDRLDEKFRVPLVLRYVDGLSYDEIAAIIRRTPSAARSRVFYGLRALAEHLPEDLAP